MHTDKKCDQSDINSSSQYLVSHPNMHVPPKPPHSEHIMEQLHHLAPHYWNRPETADCTILIPVPHRPTLPSHRSPSPRAAHPSTTKLPDVDSTPPMMLRLHTAYLSAQSTFLRGLLSGVSPLDLIQNLCVSRLQPSSVPLRVPQSQLPRLLPSLPSHPVVFLPVPDPSSIQPLFHWMYFGNTDHIENALDRGDVRWEGLARNVEYLGLSTDIKISLGRWYRSWFLPVQRSPDCAPCSADEDEESDLDSDCDDSDSDEYYSPSSPPTDDEIQSDDECDRGRTRDVKPLVQLCGRLRLRTTD